MFPSNDPSPPPDNAVGITGTVPWPLYRLLERTNCAKVCMKLQELGAGGGAVGCGMQGIGGQAVVKLVVAMQGFGGRRCCTWL